MDGMLFDVHIEETVIPGIALPLLGEHQAKNCALAMTVCKDILGERFLEKNAKAAMKKLQWPGRMEVLSCEPLTILDASINEKKCRNGNGSFEKNEDTGSGRYHRNTG